MKIKGFSVIEVILSLSISGMVLGIGVTGYFFASKQFERFKIKSEEWSEINKLHYALKRDVDGAVTIRQNANDLTCYFADGDVINYRIKNDHVIRSSNVKPLIFRISLSNVNFEAVQGTDHVQKIQFDFDVNDKKIPFLMMKEYGPDILINAEENGY